MFDSVPDTGVYNLLLSPFEQPQKAVAAPVFHNF